MKNLLRLSLTLFLLTGCAGQETRKAKSAEETISQTDVEPKARAAFNQAEKAFKEKHLKAAIEGYKSVKRQFPNGTAAQLSSYRLGNIYYSSSNYAQASQEFRSYLASYPNSNLGFDVSYNLAASEYQQSHFDKALEALKPIHSQARSQGTQRAEVVYQLGAQAASAVGNHTLSILYQAANLSLPIEDSKRNPLFSGIQSHLSQTTSAEELNVLLSQVSDETVRARINERITSLAGQNAMGGAAPVVSTQLGTPTTGDRTKIGVVLPLSGALAQYGKRALDGILLASGAFGRGSDFEVVVEDSKSSPTIAAQAVERLVEQHNVIAIIGPISWKESVAVADKAQELGVLNLSLAGKEGISEKGAYIFQNALTPRVQMESLVKHCIQEKNFRRFAILAPDNRFGEDMAMEFAGVAEKLGGLVVGYERYQADARDFQEPIQKLVLLSDLRSRKLEVKALETFTKEQQEKTKRPSKARLPPVVDFDAIFLPDGPKAVSQIAAAFAYFDVSGLPLLGTSEWNTDQLHKRGGRLVEGAIFPGGLLPSSNNPLQREFVRNYADNYGVLPDLLAVQSYEAMLLAAVAAQNSAGNRNAAVMALVQNNRFESPLGLLSFDATRIALRQLPILSLQPGGAITEQ